MTALALRRSGARPLRITPRRGVDERELDAVVIGGGTDVDPLQYGEEREEGGEPQSRRRNTLLDWIVGLLLTGLRMLFARHTLPAGYDPDRDELETHLIRHALYHDLPILGICRGAQMMNVVLGGSLHRDIGHFYNEDTRNVRSLLPAKAVVVDPDSRLYGVIGRSSCLVNALHDQSVDQLGDGVEVGATEPTGVIQAIEQPRHPFFIGVQWHPEYIPQSRTQQRLFRALVAQARRG